MCRFVEIILLLFIGKVNLCFFDYLQRNFSVFSYKERTTARFACVLYHSAYANWAVHEFDKCVVKISIALNGGAECLFKHKLEPEEKQELKKYQRLADAFTPLAKGMNSEYANQNAYDAISIHGGSGFIMEYKSQRLFRDARIFSIYEGTTQLQVVAAIRYITNGTMLNNIKEMLAGLEVSDSLKNLKARVEKLVPVYEEALNNVKALDNQDAHDFLARRLYDMTAELVMSLLILRDATKAPELFEKSANVYVRMAEENVLGKSAYIKAFQVEDLASFKAAEEEVAE